MNTYDVLLYLGCDYYGTVYVYGQHFVGNDGCSRCYCGANGEVTCDNTPCRKCCILHVKQLLFMHSCCTTVMTM